MDNPRRVPDGATIMPCNRTTGMTGLDVPKSFLINLNIINRYDSPDLFSRIIAFLMINQTVKDAAWQYPARAESYQ